MGQARLALLFLSLETLGQAGEKLLGGAQLAAAHLQTTCLFGPFPKSFILHRMRPESLSLARKGGRGIVVPYPDSVLPEHQLRPFCLECFRLSNDRQENGDPVAAWDRHSFRYPAAAPLLLDIA